MENPRLDRFPSNNQGSSTSFRVCYRAIMMQPSKTATTHDSRSGWEPLPNEPLGPMTFLTWYNRRGYMDLSEYMCIYIYTYICTYYNTIYYVLYTSHNTIYWILYTYFHMCYYYCYYLFFKIILYIINYYYIGFLVSPESSLPGECSKRRSGSSKLPPTSDSNGVILW